MAKVEHLQMLDDGSIAMVGLSGSGDAVALTIQPTAIADLLAGLEAQTSTQQPTH